jgi:hypothetical protein
MIVRVSIAVFAQRFEPNPLIYAGVGTLPRMGDLRFSLLKSRCGFFDMTRHGHEASILCLTCRSSAGPKDTTTSANIILVRIQPTSHPAS